MNSYADGINTLLYDSCANTNVLKQRCYFQRDLFLNPAMNPLEPLAREMYDVRENDLDNGGKYASLVFNKKIKDLIFVNNNNKMRFALKNLKIDGFGDCTSSCADPNIGGLKQEFEEVEFGKCRDLGICVPFETLVEATCERKIIDMSIFDEITSIILKQALDEYVSDGISSIYAQTPAPNVITGSKVPATDAEWQTLTKTILDMLPLDTSCGTRYLLILNSSLNTAFNNNITVRKTLVNSGDACKLDCLPTGFYINDSRIKYVRYADAKLMQTAFTYYSYNQPNPSTGMKGGFSKAPGAKEIMWMLVPCDMRTPTGVTFNYNNSLAKLFYKNDSIFFSDRFMANFAGFDSSIVSASVNKNNRSVNFTTQLGFGTKTFTGYTNKIIVATT